MSMLTADQRARLTTIERNEYGILCSKFVRGKLTDEDWLRLQTLAAKARGKIP